MLHIQHGPPKASFLSPPTACFLDSQSALFDSLVDHYMEIPTVQAVKTAARANYIGCKMSHI